MRPTSAPTARLGGLWLRSTRPAGVVSPLRQIDTACFQTETGLEIAIRRGRADATSTRAVIPLFIRQLEAVHYGWAVILLHSDDPAPHRRAGTGRPEEFVELIWAKRAVTLRRYLIVRATRHAPTRNLLSGERWRADRARCENRNFRSGFRAQSRNVSIYSPGVTEQLPLTALAPLARFGAALSQFVIVRRARERDCDQVRTTRDGPSRLG